MLQESLQESILWFSTKQILNPIATTMLLLNDENKKQQQQQQQTNKKNILINIYPYFKQQE